MTPQKASSSPPEIHPLSVIRILWKKKLVTAVIWMAGSIITYLVVRSIPAVYTATATVLVDAQKIPERFVASTVNADLQDRIQTITSEIESSARMKKIVDDYNLYPVARKKMGQEEIMDKMRTDITIAYVKGWAKDRPGAFTVTYQGTNPDVVSQVTNAIAELYVKQNLINRNENAAGTAEFMKTELDEAKKRLDTLETAVSEYKVKHNGELPEQGTAIANRLSRLDVGLKNDREAIERDQAGVTTLTSTLEVAEATLAAVSTPRPAAPAMQASPGNPNLGGPPMLRPPTRVEVLRAKLEDLLAHHTEEWPDVKRTRAELDVEIKREAQVAAAAPPPVLIPVPVPPSAKPGPEDDGSKSAHAVPQGAREAAEITAARERVTSLKAQIASANQDIQKRTDDEPLIQKEIEKLQSTLEGLPLREQEMASLSRDYETSKANYSALEAKKISADMATDLEDRQKAENFKVLNTATPPSRPDKPNRPLFDVIGSGLSFFIGLLLAIAMELRRNTLLGEWELPKGTPVLGRLPYIDLAKVLSQKGEGGRGGRKWWWRRAVVYSAALAGLGVLASVYVFMRRP
jgi:polysaccharide biosynthesis transport protein